MTCTSMQPARIQKYTTYNARFPSEVEASLSFTLAEKRKRKMLAELTNKIDLAERISVLFHGSKIQQQLTKISYEILAIVRNKNLSSIGILLNDFLRVVRGFEYSDLEFDIKQRTYIRVFNRLFGVKTPHSKFVKRCKNTRQQLDGLLERLHSQNARFVRDLQRLDYLYNTNLAYFHTLELYIKAGQEKLALIDTSLLPAIVAKSHTTDKDILNHVIHNLHISYIHLERRIDDLKLTHQIVMQRLEEIRLLQDNNKQLVNILNASLINTAFSYKRLLGHAITWACSEPLRDNAVPQKNRKDDSTTLQSFSNHVAHSIGQRLFNLSSFTHTRLALIKAIQAGINTISQGKRLRAQAETTLLIN